MKALSICLLALCWLQVALADETAARGREECEGAQLRYAFLANDQIECNADFLHYVSPKTSTAQAKMKIGAFNIIRINQSQARYKDYGIVATMMNQWDLVAVVEIMATPGNVHGYNKRIDEIKREIQATSMSESARKELLKNIDESYEMEGQLRILQSLRELDPSWSLIMAPEGTGSGDSYESSGFYYRRGRVNPLATKVCAGALGCPLRTPKSVQNLVSRSPFAARFRAGQVDFTGVAVHLRSRQAWADCDDPGKKENEKCVQYSPQEEIWVEKFKDAKPATERDRYIELAIISQFLKPFDDEIMILGDFNIQLNERAMGNWKNALQDDNKVVLVDAKTSISDMAGLNNNYDHFVFDPTRPSLKNCDTTSARAFNFTHDPSVERTAEDEKILAGLTKIVNMSADEKWTLFEERVVSQKMVQICEKSDCPSRFEVVPRYEGVDMEKQRADWESWVISGHEEYMIYHALVSDHIPIEMTCAA